MSTPQKRPRTDPDSTGSPSASRSRTNAGEDNSGFGETKNINVDGYGPNIQPMGPENKYPHNDTDDSQTPPPYAHISHMDGRHNDENQRKMPHRITEGNIENNYNEEDSEEACGNGRSEGDGCGSGYALRSALYPILFQITQRPVFRQIFNGLAELIARVNCNNNSDYYECCGVMLNMFSTMCVTRDSDYVWNFANNLYNLQNKPVRDRAENVPEKCDNIDNYTSHFLNYNYIDKRRDKSLYRINSTPPM